MEEIKKLFEQLYELQLSEYARTVKGGDGSELSYLPWAKAWHEMMKFCPGATYEVEKFDGLPYVYDPKTGYIVYTKVTIDGVTREMWLPVMDSKNKAMKAEPYTYNTKYGDKTVEAATMFDINRAIMRCLVKNFAMFGLGLYIYAKEDLPELSDEEKELRKKISEVDAAKLEKVLTPTQADWVKDTYHIKAYNELTNEQFGKLMREIAERANKKEDEERKAKREANGK